MLDVMTLRITLGIVSLVVLALFWAGVYRPTRSSFAGWWTMSLLWSTLSPLLLLLNGTSVQAIANPVSSAVGVWGAFSVWFATRSLRGRSAHPAVMLATSVVVLAVAALDEPGSNVWAGNGVLFAVMAVCFGLGAWDMWSAWRERRARPDRRSGQEALVALLVSSLAATVLTVFFTLRFVLFVLVGHESDVFRTAAGTGATTIVLLVSLVAVTFSVSALGYDQQTQELRRRVAEDDLTHMLGRSAWVDGAKRLVADGGVTRAAVCVIVADIDHFKAINDSKGHPVGDAVLRAFGEASRDVLAAGDIAGRMGGEEFAFVLTRCDTAAATERMQRLNERFAWLLRTDRLPSTTVSYGVAAVREGDTVDGVVERADAAMYRAKEAGRDRVVVDGAD